VTGGAERGGRYEVGEVRPAAAGLEEDEAETKREGLGTKMGGGGWGAHSSLHSERTSGRAEGAVSEMEEYGGGHDSREGHHTGREWGADCDPDGRGALSGKAQRWIEEARWRSTVEQHAKTRPSW
jgi:hypothetical protein